VRVEAVPQVRARPMQDHAEVVRGDPERAAHLGRVVLLDQLELDRAPLGRRETITISRFADGLIVEDWSVTDTLGMLRQLGMWRSVLVGLTSLRRGP
jgi:hypothetical protein